MMYVVATGGKQYVVKPGQEITVERLAQEEGANVTLPVLLAAENAQSDEPTVKLSKGNEGATVAATILRHSRSDKIPVVKFKRKVRYRRTKSHRQLQTVLHIA